MMGVKFVFVAFGAAAAALVGLQLSGDSGLATIDVITEHEVLEKHLAPFAESVVGDLPGYRGHMYRVLSYTLFQLGSAEHIEAISMALVFHDLGLWTDNDLAYIEPSVSRATNYMTEKEVAPETMQLVNDLIASHHKVTPFTGPHADVVEAFRKADLTDFSLGLLQSVGRHNVAKVMAALPNAGFHLSLIRLVTTLPKPWTIATIFRW
ncbi:hypothetical protein M885DRAFT_557484 [Pelagophyceae sp. CCMP2097]|nr:hypothetical protein M885DRAFT_557484 [Pelagophyceae sp. CCMP2097]